MQNIGNEYKEHAIFKKQFHEQESYITNQTRGDGITAHNRLK